MSPSLVTNRSRDGADASPGPGAGPNAQDPGGSDTDHAPPAPAADAPAGGGDSPAPVARRRQWGSERPRPPLAIMEKPASHTLTWAGGFAIVATILLWLGYLGWAVFSQFIDNGLQGSQFVRQTIAYVVVMTFLTFSACMYLLARQGALYRSREHVRVPRAEIDAFMAGSQPTLTVLVPSYCEDPAVVRSTLLSVALQEYPGTRTVLLLDDPPNPTDPAATASLAGCRALPDEINTLLAVPHERFRASLERHEAALEQGGPSTNDQVRALALDFVWAGRWLREQALAYPRTSNADDFLADEVMGALAGDLEITAKALFAAFDEGAVLPTERLCQLSRRLVWTFEADHHLLRAQAVRPPAARREQGDEPQQLHRADGAPGTSRSRPRSGTVLRDCDARPTPSPCPTRDYVLTLDADSVLLREYCLRLVHLLEQRGNERSRASSRRPTRRSRGAGTRLERIAGATTDLQHIVHQGMTHYDATFWVGANAVLRKRALDDIVEIDYEGDWEIRRYIQDRTVIEDTESSIDLGAHGWTLLNYPERLAYSATPPDFGSLCIQRPRWANGGLLILPKFCAQPSHGARPGRARTARRDLPAGQLHGVDLLGEPRPGVPAGATRSTASC